MSDNNPLGWQSREQVQYSLETNDELKINLVLDTLSHFNHRELVIVCDLIRMRMKVMIQERKESENN